MQHVWRRTTPLTRTVTAVVLVALVGRGHLVVRDPGRVGGDGRAGHADGRGEPDDDAEVGQRQRDADAVGAAGRELRGQRHGHRGARRGRADGHGRADARDGRHPAAGRRPAAGEGRRWPSAQAKLGRRDAGTRRPGRGRAGAGRRRAVGGGHRADRDGRRDARRRPSPGCSPRSNLEVGRRRGRSAPGPVRGAGDDRPRSSPSSAPTPGRSTSRSPTRTSRSIAVGDQAEVTLDGATEPVFGTISEIGLLSTSDTRRRGLPGDRRGHGRPGGPARRRRRRGRARLRAPHRRAHRARAWRSPPRPTGRRPSHAGRTPTASTVDVAVTVGETSGNLTEITEGLAEGDEVVLAVFTPGGRRDRPAETRAALPGRRAVLPGRSPTAAAGPVSASRAVRRMAELDAAARRRGAGTERPGHRPRRRHARPTRPAASSSRPCAASTCGSSTASTSRSWARRARASRR